MIILVFTFDLVQVVDSFEAVAGLNTEAVGLLPGEVQITSISLLGDFVFDTCLQPVEVQAEDKVGKQVVLKANVVIPGLGVHVVAHNFAFVGIA